MDAHRPRRTAPTAQAAHAPPARTDAQQRGDDGEAAALAFLVANGLRALARNVRFKAGELDLVMLDGATLVFVEVRRRGRADYGTALDSVDVRKARKLVVAARLYLQRHTQHAARDCRFDVVAFDGSALAPCWVRGAFTLDDV